MYTKQDLIENFKEIGIDPNGTLKMHSSMSAVGEVEGRADTVLDALMEYMEDGLLVLPTHTWSQENNENDIFNPRTEESCVGILTNLFWKRKNVYRSLHPSHSVAAYGKEAKEFIKGEENRRTPCPRDGVYGKLYDREAQILFLGCDLTSNTFIHGVEEWNNIPNRLSDKPINYKVVKSEDEIIECPMHYHSSPVENISFHYHILTKPLLELGIAVKGQIGDAASYLCQAKEMADLTSEFLQKDPDLFINEDPIPEEWY